MVMLAEGKRSSCRGLVDWSAKEGDVRWARKAIPMADMRTENSILEKPAAGQVDAPATDCRFSFEIGLERLLLAFIWNYLPLEL